MLSDDELKRLIHIMDNYVKSVGDKPIVQPTRDMKIVLDALVNVNTCIRELTDISRRYEVAAQLENIDYNRLLEAWDTRVGYVPPDEDTRIKRLREFMDIVSMLREPLYELENIANKIHAAASMIGRMTPLVDMRCCDGSETSKK